MARAIKKGTRPKREVRDCPKCDQPKTRNKNGDLQCLPCWQAYRKAWALQNAARIKEQNQVWHQKNKARKVQQERERRAADPLTKEKDKIRYLRHKENRNANSRSWNSRNKEQCIKAAFERRHRKIEQYRAYQRKWAATPKGKASRNAKNHKRRARILGSPGVVTEEQILLLLGSAENCIYCRKLFGTTRRDRKTLDHIEPLIGDGYHVIENLAVACGECNSRKGNRPLLVFLGELLRRGISPCPAATSLASSPVAAAHNTCPESPYRPCEATHDADCRAPTSPVPVDKDQR